MKVKEEHIRSAMLLGEDGIKNLTAAKVAVFGVGGCINGAGCLTHGEKNKAEVDKYGREALEKTISDAVSILK